MTSSTQTKTTTKRGRGRPRKTDGPKLPAASKAKKRTTKPAPAIDSLPLNPFVFEVLDLASQQKSSAKTVEALKQYEHDCVKMIMVWNFDSSVISLLPEGEVPYGETQNQTVYKGSLSENLAREAAGGESATGQDLDGRGRTSLRREYQNLYHYVKGGNDTLTTTRREMMFINLLQGLHPREAEVIVLTKDKKLGDKYNITFDQVREAYPDIVWGGRS
tara:strand:- start:1040 stop:1693 length:654 start_codon:yes stop_codon:yes gene_type:complete